MTKLASFIAAGSLLATTVMPVFATSRGSYDRKDSKFPDINARVNIANVTTQSRITANTGNNTQSNFVDSSDKDSNDHNSYSNKYSYGHKKDDRKSSKNEVFAEGNNDLSTGDVKADAITTVYANLNQPTDYSSYSKDGNYSGKHSRSKNSTINATVNYANVATYSDINANTGHNSQSNTVKSSGSDYLDAVGNNRMSTGDVDATSDTMVVVNSQWNM